MTHHTYLMMSACLACSAILTGLLVVVTPDFMFSILSWSDTIGTVHTFAIMWMTNIPSSTTSYYCQGVMYFSALPSFTNPKYLLFFTNHSTIQSAVSLLGANYPIYKPSDAITKVTLLMAVSMYRPFSVMCLTSRRCTSRSLDLGYETFQCSFFLGLCFCCSVFCSYHPIPSPNHWNCCCYLQTVPWKIYWYQFFHANYCSEICYLCY